MAGRVLARRFVSIDAGEEKVSSKAAYFSLSEGEKNPQISLLNMLCWGSHHLYSGRIVRFPRTQKLLHWCLHFVTMKGYRLNSTCRKGTWGKIQEKPSTSYQVSSLRGVAETRLILLAKMHVKKKKYCHLGRTPTQVLVSRAFTDLTHSSVPYLKQKQDSQTWSPSLA